MTQLAFIRCRSLSFWCTILVCVTCTFRLLRVRHSHGKVKKSTFRTTFMKIWNSVCKDIFFNTKVLKGTAKETKRRDTQTNKHARTNATTTLQPLWIMKPVRTGHLLWTLKITALCTHFVHERVAPQFWRIMYYEIKSCLQNLSVETCRNNFKFKSTENLRKNIWR